MSKPEDVKAKLSVSATGMDDAAKMLQSDPDILKNAGNLKVTIDTNIKEKILEPNAQRLGKGNVENGPEIVQDNNHRPTTPAPKPRGAK